MKKAYKIYGLVQGVGFRPYVSGLAEKYSLAGDVRNDGGIVTVRLSGDEDAVSAFLDEINKCKLPGAKVERIEEVTRSNDTDGYLQSKGDPDSEAMIDRDEGDRNRFRIIDSTPGGDRLRILPPDIATCRKCEAELKDPSNRRYRHPFISCVSCGPRYTIMTDVPYDRQRTLMSSFELCDKCKEEYEKPGDRRQYAQTICCPDCGPVVEAWELDKESTTAGNALESTSKPALGISGEASVSGTGDSESEDDGSRSGIVCTAKGRGAIDRAKAVLRSGGIVAIKDIGGYHFACDVSATSAVVRLREFKHRDRKPFAVMMKDMNEIARFAKVSETEEAILRGDERPIVLLNPVETEFAPKIPEEILGASNRIGAMLPCNPLQILLLDKVSPLVMTSGNRGGEPICIDDEVMKDYLKEGYIDLVLTHDRMIATGLDDSILQVIDLDDDGRRAVKSGSRKKEIVQILRRARGYVPLPVDMGRKLKADAFAAGGDLKNTFALGRENMAYLSGHFGDLDEVRCLEERSAEIERLSRLLGIDPEDHICDRHPGYVSVKDTAGRAAGVVKNKDEKPARGSLADTTADSASDNGAVSALESRRLKDVQHHHAHILAVMAEHHLTGPLLGLAYDGTGYGEDGNIWGGELLLCKDAEYERVGHLSEVKLLGADEAAKNAAQTAMLYRLEAEDAGYTDRNSGISGILRAARSSSTATYISTSAGRLFDAVAAVLGIADANTYEGECAMKLQAAAEIEQWRRPDPRFTDGERYVSRKEGCYVIDQVRIFSQIKKRVEEGGEPKVLALAFHHMLANASVEICKRIAADRGYEPDALPIALGGGCMQNALFIKLLMKRFTEEGFTVYINSLVPPGDGGISLGQMYYMTHTTSF